MMDTIVSYVVNDVVIRDVIDLFCAIPPTEYYDRNHPLFDGQYEYVIWLSALENCWVEAYINIHTAEIKYIKIHPDIAQKENISEIIHGPNISVTTLLNYVCMWVKSLEPADPNRPKLNIFQKEVIV